MIKQSIAIVCLLVLSLNANAVLFSTTGVVNGSNSYSVTVDGITMTLASNGGGSLANFPTVSSFDVGDFAGLFSLESFDISFSERVLLSGFHTLFAPGSPTITLAGHGLLESIEVPDEDTDNIFSNGPLLLERGLAYSITVSPFGTGNVALAITNFQASPVPIPTAAWLFGSALIGLVGFKRKK